MTPWRVEDHVAVVLLHGLGLVVQQGGSGGRWLSESASTQSCWTRGRASSSGREAVRKNPRCGGKRGGERLLVGWQTLFERLRDVRVRVQAVDEA
jgi:hypothetical protein